VSASGVMAKKRRNGHVLSLEGAALNRLNEAVSRYEADLRAEVVLREAAERRGDGPPEVTSTMVDDAERIVRRAYTRRPRAVRVLVLKLVGYGATALAAYEVSHSGATWFAYAFVPTILIGACAVAAEFLQSD
jgi:hypothetical protein